MKIRVFSDLHVNRGPFEPASIAADVVVLAGDVALGVDGVRWASERFGHTPVLYVAGNHESYNQDVTSLAHLLKQAAAGSNVTVLEKDAVTLSGVTFYGCTLWSDLSLGGDAVGASNALSDWVSDFRRIRVATGGPFTPSDMIAEHRASVSWLSACKPLRSPAVVITHHAPSGRSVDHQVFSAQAHEPASAHLPALYASALDTLVEELAPALWIHGHIHAASDYRIGSTRVLCNPRGYPNALARGFQPELVVEL